jgi:hypothetical protein
VIARHAIGVRSAVPWLVDRGKGLAVHHVLAN